MLEFEHNKLSVYSRKWDNLEIHAPEWLDGFHFMCIWQSADGRQIGAPEFRVGSQVAPAVLLAQLYNACASAFPGNLPLEFQIGKEEYLYLRRAAPLMPPPPQIWADRKFLRFCLSYLDERADWSAEDYRLRLAVIDGQLRIEGKSDVMFCPVRGEWLGSSFVSAQVLFRRLPKRFARPVVVLQQQGDGLRIDGHVIPAMWEETH